MARILLVEDNEYNSDMLSRRLSKRGFEVAIAIDGESCVEKAKAFRPDLILMDLGLPGIDGFEATRRLKSEAATRDIPIIALSAHTADGDVACSAEAGCADFDEKPIDLPRLLGKMACLLPDGSITCLE